ncbi:putative autophagy-related protein 15 [[Candida] railenensis]|uniref:triacylglycerol lipase n=1 Tax=[Candida] railenensis TaxID=45579 RepID=A0A9P0VZN7_9ASCO|nr:putative autophagy-related protein 15 [[Candida] railenensis]
MMFGNPHLTVFIILTLVYPSTLLGTSIHQFIAQAENPTFYQLQQYQGTAITPVTFKIYQDLYTYAHLIDISYCVSNTNQISEPFECDLGCSKAFPNITLLYQWFFDDTVAGYIALSDHPSEINDTSATLPGKTLIVSLRGTRSAPDTYTDLRVEMTSYTNLNKHLPSCGPNCRVHRGFFNNYLSTLNKINPVIEKAIEEYDNEGDLQILIMGHSLGGAVALLLALHYLDSLGNSNKLKLVTMGQPLVGNKQFTNWADMQLQSFSPIEERKFWRVIHKGDVVATLPNKKLSIIRQEVALEEEIAGIFPPFINPPPPIDLQPDFYQQFDNQIYINCSSHNYNPIQSEVVDCWTATNKKCIQGDFPPLSERKGPQDKVVSYDSHLAYFRKMGFCGVRI